MENMGDMENTGELEEEGAVEQEVEKEKKGNWLVAVFCCCLVVLATYGGLTLVQDGNIGTYTEPPKIEGGGGSDAGDLGHDRRAERQSDEATGPLLKTGPLQKFSPVGTAFAQSLQTDRANVTPSHVFQATLDLISEIELLREAMGVNDYPSEAEPQEDRAPVHVYSKSLEVMKKVARFQRRLGMPPGRVGQIPVKQIVPKDVLGSVTGITEQLRRVKKQLVINDKIRPASFEGAKTPSMVYKNLGDASFLLDGLVGRPLTPNDVFANVVEAHDEMELIAAKLKVALALEPPVIEGRRRPKDVAQQVLRATYKVINLQTRLGMDASGVPNLTLVRVTPAEVYEATNILLAEFVRIKKHLNVTLPRSPRPEPRNKKPNDVFVQVLLMIENLDRLAKAAAKSG